MEQDKGKYVGIFYGLSFFFLFFPFFSFFFLFFFFFFFFGTVIGAIME